MASPPQHVATVNGFLTVGFTHVHCADRSYSRHRATIQQSFDIDGRTHGHNGSDRGYKLASLLGWAAPAHGDGNGVLEGEVEFRLRRDFDLLAFGGDLHGGARAGARD
jgi:hypothetical protein